MTLHCDTCGRFLRADYTAECDFDYDMARKAGFLVDETQDLNVSTADSLLAPFLYTLDAGFCPDCGDLSIHFDGPRHYFNPQTQHFDIEEDFHA